MTKAKHGTSTAISMVVRLKKKEVKQKMKNNKKAWKIGTKKGVLTLGLMLITVVSAAFLVTTAEINIEVKEPLTVKYETIGSKVPEGFCERDSLDYDQSTIPDLGGYPGESKGVCLKICNQGDNTVPYEVTVTDVSPWIEINNTCNISEAPADDCTFCHIDATIRGDAPPGRYSEYVEVLRG